MVLSFSTCIFLPPFFHHIVNDIHFWNLKSIANLDPWDISVVDQVISKLPADAQHLTKLSDGHDVRVFRKQPFYLSIIILPKSYNYYD